MEPKIILRTTDGKPARVGSDIIELTDESFRKFQTSDISSFLKFITEQEKPELLIYTNRSIIAKRAFCRMDEDVAICSLQNSNPLSQLSRIIGSFIVLENFEAFLKYMVTFVGQTGLNLLSKLKDFKVTKTTNIERQKDQAGNYSYICERKNSVGNSKEKESFTPPDKLKFNFPIFQFIDERRDFEFDVYFDFVNQDDKVIIKFKIDSPFFTEQLQEYQKEIIESILEEQTCEKYMGEFEHRKEDNSWKYKPNPLIIKAH